MKSLKILLLGAFIMLVSNSVSAQKWGVRAGVNISDINADGWDSDAKTGLYVGVYKEIPLVKSLLFIQPEVQYSQEGFSTDYENVGDVKVDYLTVPVLAKVYVAKLLSFETGPQFGFLVNDSDFTDANSFIPSWAFGTSLNLPLGLSINARYISGLDDTYDGLSGKNQVFQVGAAFQF
ncbi:porin family protein [Flavobacterium aquicola]|uniref:Outer membrane protein with beta-barrel domain n=1 Tax=Flavobacterium aquicola TaxID=1682742 RepID=A0A3E0E5P0_9FLAO|nr:porin family protein [Flavobacterium aquicola]REG92950.1 outer membrane protein with beta-barrel domain [Flavobacterium aquicola]